MIARMDAVIATSEASAAYLRRPATVVLHGVDPERYRPPPDRAAAFAASGLARQICDRLLRPRARAEGHRSVRRGDVPAAAAISGFQRRRDRAGDAGSARLRATALARACARPGSPTASVPGRVADRRGAALVSAHLDLCLHLPQRRLRADAARSHGGGLRRWSRRAPAVRSTWCAMGRPACWYHPTMSTR